jgi:predicted PurR-regulated permease PerM
VTQDANVFRRAAIVLVMIVALLAAWRLRELILLLFGSVLIAVLLRRLMLPVKRWTRLPEGAALFVAVAGVLLLLVVFGAFFGWGVQGQIAEAADLIPKGLAIFTDWVRNTPIGGRILGAAQQFHISAAVPALMAVPLFAWQGMVILGESLAALVGGIYLAAQPDLYRGGLLRVLPARLRPWTESLLEETGSRLRQWLIAQFVAMVSIGVLVGAGLALIGVPAPLALGLFAGLVEFVPVAGPIVGAIPALLIALLHGLDKAGYVLLLFVLVQQFEGHVLLPVVQQRFATLPPVVTIFALLGFAVLFGWAGALFATPLAVVGAVLLKHVTPKDKPAPDAQP